MIAYLCGGVTFEMMRDIAFLVRKKDKLLGAEFTPPRLMSVT